MIRLFDIQNGVVIPTEHCYANKSLKIIMDKYPEDYLSIYAYLFYMTCPDPKENCYCDINTSEKEELIIIETGLSEADVSPEDNEIRAAKQFCEKLYSTPTLRAYMGIKTMLDRLAEYMEDTALTDGRDGNIVAIVNAASKFEQIRVSYKGAYKDLMEEQKGSFRGNASMAYDQMK